MVDRAVFLCLSLFFLLSGCPLGQRISISGQDRSSLLELRSSLGLRAREWPIKSDPCASWVGIQCSGGRVTGISISGFRRTRRGSRNPQFSVDALRNLTLLSSFNASNFALPGSIPEWLGSELGALQVLDLRSCSVNGVIPATLGNLSGLVELYLSNNNLTGVIPSSIGQLTSLNVLDLSQNMLTGQTPAPFSVLRNLTVLDLSSNFLSGPIPPEIGTFSGLQFLNLSRNSFSSSIPTQLVSLSSLINLDLAFNSLSGPLPADFRALRNLRRLLIGSNFLTGQLPDTLWSIPSLQFLDVSGNNFTGILPSNTTPSPRLTNDSSASVLNISRNSFYGSITPLITRFSSVDLSGNYFEGAIPIYARGPTQFLDRNCLRNLTTQRSLAECSSFYAERNLVFDNFGQPNAPLPPHRPGRRSRRSVVLLASVLGGIGLIGILLLIIMLFIIVCKRRRARTSQRGVVTVGPVPAGSPPPPEGQILDFTSLGEKFAYEKILEFTGDFNEKNLLKKGHSGDLYRGVLEGGEPVVVKKFDLSSSVKKESYASELELFSKVSHPRLVPLVGHCLEKEDEKFLVYKYMPNVDLSSSLFRKVGPDGSLQSLDWITRLKIAIGAAEGLSYLHHECNPPLVHRDVQASSILLDDKFEVRLGSLSEVCAQEGDIHQSRITKFLRLPQSSDQGSSGTPNATCAYDVYCFGKVLLELVTGKLGPDSSTKDWLDSTLRHISIYDKDLVTDILDPTLMIDEDLLEEVWAMAIVARSCLNPKPNRRPLMRYILKALENPLKVVRDEQQHTSSERRGSWNAALFGSWRHSSSDVAAQPAAVAAATSAIKVEESSSGKRSGMSGSLNGGDNNNNGNSSSARKSSKDIFPEPLEEGLV
ncbi:Probable LRR receptor-like serine/threonine-protein kinase [Striga hermonthica]|uniref:Probable LRR receptor-like serine/threonine-protein kinase n=1 Tax=Striga hermonthica TaxID=68872 RepID=A0A9N7RH25_STRHE|nr:Probable LRR receptor-like serine/threonine-protein kinase [Striga hermonthica]